LRAVNGRELLFQHPRRAAALEDINRTLAGFPDYIVARRADHQPVAADRDRGAEESARNAVNGGELLPLRPRRARASEDIYRTLILADKIIGRRGHHQRVAADRDRLAEAIMRRAVDSDDFLLQRPCTALGPALAREDVNRTLILVGPDVVGRSGQRQRGA